MRISGGFGIMTVSQRGRGESFGATDRDLRAAFGCPTERLHVRTGEHAPDNAPPVVSCPLCDRYIGALRVFNRFPTEKRFFLFQRTDIYTSVQLID